MCNNLKTLSNLWFKKEKDNSKAKGKINTKIRQYQPKQKTATSIE
jgi:hypothetical protein